MLIALGNSSKKLLISRTWWLVWNFSAIFCDAFVSSILSENFTEIDSISFVGYSFLNNARTSAESIPELSDIPIFPVFDPISSAIFCLIDFSTNCSFLSPFDFSWKSLVRSLEDKGSKLVE